MGQAAGSSVLGEAHMDRRTVLVGIAATGLTSLLGGCQWSMSPSRVSHPALSAPHDHGRVALLTARTSGAELREALQLLASRVRSLPTGLLGLGHGIFDKLGVSERRPARLVPMESFAGDVLDPSRVDADLIVQIDGAGPDRADEVLASVLDGIDALEVTWQSALSRDDNEVAQGRSLNRNVFGFTEGFANPSGQDEGAMDRIALIGSGVGEPAWAVGGSYLALRILTVSHDLWDAEDIELQEQIVGRRRDGTWLDGTPAHDEPDFAADSDGEVTPLDSHVRLANPRDGSPPPLLVRRSWTWAADAESRGDGLLFMAFQADLDAGFRRAQERLTADRLSRYVLATGGGYFVVPPDADRSGPWEDVVLR